MNWLQKIASRFEVLPAESFGYDEPNDEYFYHVTSIAKLPEIQQYGLRPNRSSTVKGWYEGYSKGKVFFCERQSVGFWRNRIEEHLFASYDDPPDVVVIRFLKTGVQFKEDTVGTKDSRKPSYYSEHPIGLNQEDRENVT